VRHEYGDVGGPLKIREHELFVFRFELGCRMFLAMEKGVRRTLPTVPFNCCPGIVELDVPWPCQFDRRRTYAVPAGRQR
jgi:hypothetical protein